MPEAHVLENGQIDEARRAHPIAIWLGRAIADKIEAQLPFRRFDATVSFARFGSEPAQLRLRINNRSFRDVAQSLLKDLEGLAHLQDPDHIAVVNIPMVSERHAEVEPVVDAVLVHLANVVVDSARPKHRAGDASVDSEVARQATHPLRARYETFVLAQQGLILIKKAREFAHYLLRLVEPPRRQITTAAAEAHVIAHHPGPGKRLE